MDRYISEFAVAFIVFSACSIGVGYAFLFIIYRFIDRWASKGTAYGNTSVFQTILILMSLFCFVTSLNLIMKEPSAGLVGIAASVNSSVIAVVIALLYEGATGVSLLTGKVKDEEKAERVKAGRGKEAEPVAPLPPQPEPAKKWPWRKPKVGRWTAKAVVCLILAAAFALFAYDTSNELLYFPAVACAVALLLDYISCIFAFRRMRHITLSREAPGYAGEDDLVEIDFTLNNAGKEVSHIVLVDNFPAETGSQRQRKVVIDSLPQQSEEAVSYRAVCYQRGVFDIGPVEIRREFPFGLFRNRLIFDEFTRIKIYPHLYEVHDFNLHFGGAKQRIGLSTIEKAGLSNDFFGIREYVPGDPKRLIHWKSSAKRGTLMVKELEKPADFDLTAIIDLDITVGVGLDKYNTFEYSLKIVGSLARLVLQKRYDMRILALGDGYRELDLNRGMQEFPLVLDFLASLKQKRTMPIEDTILYLLDSLRQDTTLLLPLQNPYPEIVSTLLMLRAKNIETRVFLFDRSTFTYKVELIQEYRRAFHETVTSLRRHNFIVYPIRYEDGPMGSLLGGIGN